LGRSYPCACRCSRLPRIHSSNSRIASFCHRSQSALARHLQTRNSAPEIPPVRSWRPCAQSTYRNLVVQPAQMLPFASLCYLLGARVMPHHRRRMAVVSRSTTTPDSLSFPMRAPGLVRPHLDRNPRTGMLGRHYHLPARVYGELSIEVVDGTYVTSASYRQPSTYILQPPSREADGFTEPLNAVTSANAGAVARLRRYLACNLLIRRFRREAPRPRSARDLALVYPCRSGHRKVVHPRDRQRGFQAEPRRPAPAKSLNRL
jgi:hypothetical protein